MTRLTKLTIGAVGVCLAAGVGWRGLRREPSQDPIVVKANANDRIRRSLFAAIQPVVLSNCELKRFGEANDGGYVMCGNLLGAVQAGYSYGISGYDGWGCQVSRELKVRVHQYDCFDLHTPVCPGGDTTFHSQCIAPTHSTDESGRVFDSLQKQIADNRDTGKHLVLKMDVEGAEWESFLQTPDSVLEQVDQLAVEFHGANRLRYLEAIISLKRFFHVANLHFNNYSCTAGVEPFPSWAYEVLFVSKRLGVLDPSGKRPDTSAVNARNNPTLEDCQP
jgi:hypothetical protein